jgi:hypothetical protein
VACVARGSFRRAARRVARTCGRKGLDSAIVCTRRKCSFCRQPSPAFMRGGPCQP